MEDARNKNSPNMFNISFHKYLQLQHIFRPNWFQLVLNPLVLELVYTFSLEGIIAADLKLLPPLLLYGILINPHFLWPCADGFWAAWINGVGVDAGCLGKDVGGLILLMPACFH